MQSIQEVNQAIMFGGWTNEELESMISAIKFKRASLINGAKRSLKVGATVSWSSSRSGQTEQGTVQKVAQKYATVKAANGTGLWRIPMNMLTVA